MGLCKGNGKALRQRNHVGRIRSAPLIRFYNTTFFIKNTVLSPYYFGVNHCTGVFPGSFSLKPETFEQVLFEIFGNLHDFGFDEVYCFNYHGDPLHFSAITNAIKRANHELSMKVRFMMEEMDLQVYPE